MALPHPLQKCAAQTFKFPHWQQKRPELVTGTRRTGTGLVPGAHAQMKATIQPTTVQPKNRLTRKISPASDLFLPISEGRKYIKQMNRRKSIEPSFHSGGQFSPLPEYTLTAAE